MSSQTSEFANFISSTEAAQTYGVSSTYITKLARSGVIQALKIGRNWIIEKNSLLSYLNTPHKRGPKGPRNQPSQPSQ